MPLLYVYYIFLSVISLNKWAVNVAEFAFLSLFSCYILMFHTLHYFSFPLLLWYLHIVSVPPNESQRLFGSFKHKASDSPRLWLVWDWTHCCCWAQGGMAYSDDLTHWPHSALTGGRALCLLHEVIIVGFCRAVCALETLTCCTDVGWKHPVQVA